MHPNVPCSAVYKKQGMKPTHAYMSTVRTGCACAMDVTQLKDKSEASQWRQHCYTAEDHSDPHIHRKTNFEIESNTNTNDLLYQTASYSQT